MFKAFKYLLLANLYKKAKKSFIMLFIYIVSLILLSFIINDIVSISSGAVVYILLLVKWASILTLLGLICFSLLKIYNIASNPFSMQKETHKIDKEVSSETQRERILAKKKIFTASDLILQKYMRG